MSWKQLGKISTSDHTTFRMLGDKIGNPIYNTIGLTINMFDVYRDASCQLLLNITNEWVNNRTTLSLNPTHNCHEVPLHNQSICPKSQPRMEDTLPCYLKLCLWNNRLKGMDPASHNQPRVRASDHKSSFFGAANHTAIKIDLKEGQGGGFQEM